MFRTKHGYANVTCMCIYICLSRSLKTPISTHIYKLALKFTFNLVECPILCSFEVLILIVMFSMYRAVQRNLGAQDKNQLGGPFPFCFRFRNNQNIAADLQMFLNYAINRAINRTTIGIQQMFDNFFHNIFYSSPLYFWGPP